MSEKTLADLGHESLYLAGLIQGIDVINAASEGNEDCPITKRASNALMPLIEVAIEKAFALNESIEHFEHTHTQKQGNTRETEAMKIGTDGWPLGGIDHKVSP